MNRITLNILIDRIRKWCDAHLEVNEFSFGELWEHQGDKREKWTLVHISDTDPVIQADGFVFNLRVFCLGMTQLNAGSDLEKEQSIQKRLSDNLMILQDLMTELMYQKTFFKFDTGYIKLQSKKINAIQYIEDKEQVLTGYEVNLPIFTTSLGDLCEIPYKKVILSNDQLSYEDAFSSGTAQAFMRFSLQGLEDFSNITISVINADDNTTILSESFTESGVGTNIRLDTSTGLIHVNPITSLINTGVNARLQVDIDGQEISTDFSILFDIKEAFLNYASPETDDSRYVIYSNQGSMPINIYGLYARIGILISLPEAIDYVVQPDQDFGFFHSLNNYSNVEIESVQADFSGVFSGGSSSVTVQLFIGNSFLYSTAISRNWSTFNTSIHRNDYLASPGIQGTWDELPRTYNP